MVEGAEIKDVRAGGAVIHRRRQGRRHLRHPPGLDDRREEGRRKARLPLLPAGRLLCRRDGADRRTARVRATVKAAIKSEVIRLPARPSAGCSRPSRTLLERRRPTWPSAGHQRLRRGAQGQSSPASSTCIRRPRSFLVENGIGEATDVLLIDETLRRLRQLRKGLRRQPSKACRGSIAKRAGPIAHLHVPTSCRHCEASALHGRLPAQRDQARPGRRGVHRRYLHRLRQLPAQLPLRRDPDGQRAAEKAEPA